VAGAQERTVDYAVPSNTYDEVRAKSPPLNSKGNFERVPYLYSCSGPPDPGNGSPVPTLAGVEIGVVSEGTLDNEDTTATTRRRQHLLIRRFAVRPVLVGLLATLAFDGGAR
jgi:hypothetical protein